MLGSYGYIVFTVSNGKVLTFDGLEKDLSARFSKQEIHLNKPVLEFIGEDLAEIKLNIKLDTSLGINPKKQIISTIVFAHVLQICFIKNRFCIKKHIIS